MEVELDYECALKIVRAKDKTYAEEMTSLIALLEKYHLSENAYITRSGNITESVNEYVANLYRRSVIKRAEKHVIDASISLILKEKLMKE